MEDALGQRLATLHNVRYFLRLMEHVRAAIEAGEFSEFVSRFLRDEKTLYLGGEKEFSAFPESFA
jgi:tRNA-guanine family transglycosylase